MSMPRLDTEIVVNQFRLQPLIEDEIAKGEELRKPVNSALALAGISLNRFNQEMAKLDKIDITKLDGKLLMDLALTYVEVGDWNFVNACLCLFERFATVQDRQLIAYSIYLKGVVDRENNRCQSAIDCFKKVLSFSLQELTPWLMANTYRNLGLAHLKNSDQSKDLRIKSDELENAHQAFHNGWVYLYQDLDPKLEGSKPAMLNYRALVLCKRSLLKNEFPSEGLESFAAATKVYELTFPKVMGNSMSLDKSHDWQSHNLHRAMINRQIVAQKLYRSDEERDQLLSQASTMVEEAIKGRIANKADGQRLGDAYFTKGEISESKADFASSKTVKALFLADANAAFVSAKWHYLAVFGNNQPSAQLEKVQAKFDGLLPQLRSVISERSVTPQQTTDVPAQTHYQQFQ